MSRKFARMLGMAMTAIFCVGGNHAWSQKITKIERSQALDMIQQISPDIKKHYYDPKFHGVDWNARVDQTEQKINTTDSMPQALAAVASALGSFNDSHTFFLPPAYAAHYDYGWQAQMVGDRCLVIRVRAGSDAEKKGLKSGDELIAIDGFAPTREAYWKIEYVFDTLRPQPGLVLDVRDPGGQQRRLQVATTVIPQKSTLDLTGTNGDGDIWDVVRQQQNEDHAGRAQFSAVSEDVGILKLPSFALEKSDVDRIMDKVHKHKALVLDLRGDPGGYIEILQYLIGATFDKETKIGDRVGRSVHKPLIAKPHDRPFTGKLVVLVDSKSASAAELFARVVQIEKRGTVLGDRSSGSVMEAKRYSYKSGADTVIYFGASITDADIVMTDGKSLEHVGVVPDEVVLPSADDLANGRDPVLAHAVETVGGKMTPEAAGKLFPYEWPKI
ncbi:MAG: S41 family peptidase [Acidobacteriaceae bacterium]